MLAVRVILVTLRTEHRQTEGTMTDTGGPVELPTAGVHRRRRIPLVWIVPIVTALIALWLAWDTLSKRGPTITIATGATITVTGQITPASPPANLSSNTRTSSWAR